MQLPRGSLRKTLRTIDVWIRGTVLHGFPGLGLQHERHNYRICHYETRRVAAVQLRATGGRTFGFCRVGIGGRKSGVFVRRCKKRHHLDHHKNGELRVGRRMEEGNSNQKRKGGVLERVHVQGTRRYLRRLQTR